MTNINPTKPVVYILNNSTLADYNSKYHITQTFQCTPDRYYYYTVYIGRNRRNILYHGKTWCYTNAAGRPELKIDMTSITKTYQYSGYGSLMPLYDPFTQTYREQQETTAVPIDVNTEYEQNGYGVAYFYVYIFDRADEVGRHSNALFYYHMNLTSSWNLKQPVMDGDNSYGTQDLLTLEYPNWVSHYPYISTSRLNVSYLANVGNNALNTDPVWRFGSRQDYTHNITVTEPFGYHSINMDLGSLLPYISDEPTGEEPVYINAPVPGSSSTVENSFTTGTSTIYRWTDSYRASEITQQVYSHAYNLYMYNMGEQTLVATFDPCPKKYYLKWQTRSCAPACIGFNGRSTISQNNQKTMMKDALLRNVAKMNNMTERFSINTGFIDKDTYVALQDIFTSPWLELYDTTRDELFYVNVTDTDYAIQDNVFVNNQPYNLTLNLEKTDETTLLF